MSHVFTVPDEEYARLERAAEPRGVTVEQLFQAWVGSVTAADETETTDEHRIRAAQQHWAALNPGAAPLTVEELREHPLLQAMGACASGEPDWAERHDELLAEPALDTHAGTCSCCVDPKQGMILHRVQ